MIFQLAMGLSVSFTMCFSKVGKAQSTKNNHSPWQNKEGKTPASILFQHENVLLCADLLQDFRPNRYADLTQVSFSEQQHQRA